jgi:hypothetical protein
MTLAGKGALIYGFDARHRLGDEHRRQLSERLRIHHSAFVFRRLESLPLAANGKIDYQKLTGLP